MRKLILSSFFLSLTSTTAFGQSVRDCDPGDAPAAFASYECESVCGFSGSSVDCSLDAATSHNSTMYAVTYNADEAAIFGEVAGRSGDTVYCCVVESEGAGFYLNLDGSRYDDTMGFTYLGDDLEDTSSPKDVYPMIDGDDGDDTIYGSNAELTVVESLYGGDGDDIIAGGQEEEYIYGGDGDDILLTGLGTSEVWAGAGNDNVIASGASGVVAYGEGGDDTLLGSGSFDYLHGGDGDDTLEGFGSADVLYGGRGQDELRGGAGDDHLCETARDLFCLGAQTLRGDAGSDVGWVQKQLRGGGIGCIDIDGNNTIEQALDDDFDWSQALSVGGSELNDDSTPLECADILSMPSAF